MYYFSFVALLLLGCGSVAAMIVSLVRKARLSSILHKLLYMVFFFGSLHFGYTQNKDIGCILLLVFSSIILVLRFEKFKKSISVGDTGFILIVVATFFAMFVFVNGFADDTLYHMGFLLCICINSI